VAQDTLDSHEEVRDRTTYCGVAWTDRSFSPELPLFPRWETTSDHAPFPRNPSTLLESPFSSSDLHSSKLLTLTPHLRVTHITHHICFRRSGRSTYTRILEWETQMFPEPVESQHGSIPLKFRHISEAFGIHVAFFLSFSIYEMGL
jgi:hypothetical protein